MSLSIPSHTTGQGKPAGRIRQKNEVLIIAAAEKEFARHGYKGTSMNAIALKADLPKANLHYYFNNKLGLYQAVLANILDQWDSAFNHLTADADPALALSNYIRTKMEFSRTNPDASRVFAMEVISKGPFLNQYLNQDYRDWLSTRTAVFKTWIAAGKMEPVDPEHLIFLLWSSTQHYADFGAQICQAQGKSKLTRQDFKTATDNLINIILKGCGLTPPT